MVGNIKVVGSRSGRPRIQMYQGNRRNSGCGTSPEIIRKAVRGGSEFWPQIWVSLLNKMLDPLRIPDPGSQSFAGFVTGGGGSELVPQSEFGRFP